MSTSQVIATSAIVSIIVIGAMFGTAKMVAAHTPWGSAGHSGFKVTHFLNHDNWQNSAHITHVKETCQKRGHEQIEHMVNFISEEFELTALQLEKWQAVASAVQGEQQTLDMLCDKFFTKENHATTPARLELAQAVMATGAETLQRLQPAITDFYNSLDETQQRSVDDLIHRKHQRHHS